MWGLCADLCSTCGIAQLEMRSSCVTRASIWASIPSRVCWMQPSDSSLTSLCTPAPSPVCHFTPQRSGFLSPSLSLLLSLSLMRKKWGEAVFLLSSWCFLLWGAKELWRYVPYLTLLQTGPDISFHHRYKHWTGRASTLKCYKFVLCPVCFYVRVCPVSLCCSAVQYLSHPCGEDQLEGDWRINAILKQNTTCQLFTPSLPFGGWMSWFSWRTVNLSPWPTRAGRKENHAAGDAACFSCTVQHIHSFW